jgi:hypothetical protein
MSDKKRLYDLENELAVLMAEAAERTGMSAADIGLELEDSDAIRILPRQVSPDVWDSDGRMRRTYRQILAIKQRIGSENAR